MAARRFVLVLLLGGAIALSLQSLMWSPQDGAPGALPEIVQPVVRADAATLHQVPAAAERDGLAGRDKPDAPPQLMARPEPPSAPRDLFAAYSWAPPAPPPAPAPPPQAPPLPFTYAGRMEVNGASTYLLLQGDRAIWVSVGASVGEFTLTSAGPEGLQFLHQPTGLTQALPAPGLPVASN